MLNLFSFVLWNCFLHVALSIMVLQMSQLQPEWNTDIKESLAPAFRKSSMYYQLSNFFSRSNAKFRRGLTQLPWLSKTRGNRISPPRSSAPPNLAWLAHLIYRFLTALLTYYSKIHSSLTAIDLSLIFEFFKCLPFRVCLAYSSDICLYFDIVSDGYGFIVFMLISSRHLTMTMYDK